MLEGRWWRGADAGASFGAAAQAGASAAVPFPWGRAWAARRVPTRVAPKATPTSRGRCGARFARRALPETAPAGPSTHGGRRLRPRARQSVRQPALRTREKRLLLRRRHRHAGPGWRQPLSGPFDSTRRGLQPEDTRKTHRCAEEVSFLGPERELVLERATSHKFRREGGRVRKPTRPYFGWSPQPLAARLASGVGTPVSKAYTLRHGARARECWVAGKCGRPSVERGVQRPGSPPWMQPRPGPAREPKASAATRRLGHCRRPRAPGLG